MPPVGGHGRGLSCGFHWLLLLEHWRCFWRLQTFTEAEPAETALEWPFQDSAPKELLLECPALESVIQKTQRDPGICFRGGGDPHPGG